MKVKAFALAGAAGAFLIAGQAQADYTNVSIVDAGNPNAGQFCIETQLAAAQHGDLKRGLFFRGSEPLPFGDQIRTVHELLEYLLTGKRPATA